VQNIFIERNYQFIPPIRSRWFPSLVNRLGFFPWYLRRTAGVRKCQVLHADRLLESVRAGHGVLVTPNHPTTLDPLLLSNLAHETGLLFYAMASWHLFHGSWLERNCIRMMGGFSVYREGLDRQAIDMAIDTLTAAERPLVVFAEGTATRTNDRLSEMLDGISFIARTAAKRRAKQEPAKRVVVHPIAIKYKFVGDMDKTVVPVLERLERRLTFRPMSSVDLVERLRRIGTALLALKEIEYFGEPRQGRLRDRQAGLVERLMQPLEQEWLGRPQSGGIVTRVKNLRMKIFPEIARGEVDAAERDRRFRHLADTYLAQQVAFYPTGYLDSGVTIERIVETVHRFEEDMTDESPMLGPLDAIIEVLPAIEVEPGRDRGAESDPLMAKIGASLQEALDRLALEGTPYRSGETPAPHRISEMSDAIPSFETRSAVAERASQPSAAEATTTD